MIRRLPLVVAFLAIAAVAEAGPWGLGRGHVYGKLGFGHLRSTELVAPDGTSFDIPRFTKDEVGLTLGYGLDDSWTVFTNLPLLRASDLRDQPDELQRESGFGDLQLGLQRQLGRAGPWLFAARASIQAPTGDVSRAGGLLPTGSGVWEGDAVLSAGRSFASGKLYGFLEAGPQVRGGGLRDGVVYGAQMGWNATDRLVLAWNVRGVEPFSHRAPTVARGSFAGVGDRVTYVSTGPTLLWKATPRFGVQVDLDATAHARNLARGPAVRAGIFFSR